MSNERKVTEGAMIAELYWMRGCAPLSDGPGEVYEDVFEAIRDLIRYQPLVEKLVEAARRVRDEEFGAGYSGLDSLNALHDALTAIEAEKGKP